ncbi:hypothetical protein [Amycolatopsis sp. WGS_07]|uniref:hypothetical protein n=1 Tax=Amycolatopsis sp. WGS_07 TaxID=3076764 RepID=UPI003872C3ED
MIPAGTAAARPGRSAAASPFAGTFTGDLAPWYADNPAGPLDGYVLLLLDPNTARVGIRRYSDDHPDTRVPPLRHVYLLVDLRGTWLAIYPLCAGRNATPHDVRQIDPREYRALGDDATACPGCAGWLRDNPHIVVVGGEDAACGGLFERRVAGDPPTTRFPPAAPVPEQRTAAPAARDRLRAPAAPSGTDARRTGAGPGAVPARLAPAGFGPPGPLFAFPLIAPPRSGRGFPPVQHTENRGASCVFED